MNHVTLIGRLTADPILKYTPSGTAVAEFGMATDNGRDKDGNDRPADFHNIKAWDRTAETLAEHVRKGRQLAIEGRLTTRSWDGDCGKKHYRTEIVVSRFYFLGKKDDEADRVAAQVAAATGGEVLDVDEPPF